VITLVPPARSNHRKKRVEWELARWQTTDMNDYERIARMIRYLNSRHTEQPDLATLARQAGLSQFHFHRLFAAWAGVTPKDFLQCLTLAHAKQLLRKGASVLEATLDTGLSSPARLHDLCVNLEAASPGELKSGGEGWRLIFGFAQTPFGNCLVAASPRGICHLSFVESKNGREPVEALKEQWPRASLKHDVSVARATAARIFNESANGESRAPLRAFVRGTAFQVRVWRALLQVEAGHLISYGSLARAVGQSSAARAVGSAVANNPLAYVIPCHRVIRETGVAGEYRWGAIRKRAMIAWESAARGGSRPTGAGPNYADEARTLLVRD
jgi:AraC family transcriptional regulator of adaptative response/methylated-DNA-[protein]-cysteine methyltransferase